MERVTQEAFTIIDMLLMNLKENPLENNFDTFSIFDCISDALLSYPLHPTERALIIWQKGEDFQVNGTQLLIKHILFNLLKNALYYIKVVNKGGITIWTKSDSQHNTLYFKDTGKGIPKDMLPYIFDRFYSKTDHGTGIGLAFCKQVMEGLEGSITCQSKEGEFTQFTLKFPVFKRINS